MVNKLPAWVNSPESDRLEYKSEDALASPQSITRAVVALLNHRGGHVIVGVDDEGTPSGLADTVDPARERDRLQNLLIDRIEPRPLGLVRVEHKTVAGRVVLEVTVETSKSVRLHAERRQGLYGFWIRTGSVTRAYTLDEVRDIFQESGEQRAAPTRWDHPISTDNDTVLVLQAELANQTLDLQSVRAILEPEHRVHISRRDMGWTVVDDYDRPGPIRRRALEVGARGERKWLRFDEKHHTIRFEGRSEFLTWKPHPIFTRQVIYPFPLVEGTVSFFWLLALYAQHTNAEGTVHCQLGLWRPAGWRLGPGRPGSLAWDREDHWRPIHDNVNIEHAADLTWQELRDAPDRAAYPFVAEVYEDFGYDRDVIPFWSDDEQRFVFG